jgi:hypothetical protein
MPIANAVTAMLLGAAMAAAQAPTSFPGWTLNGSAIMEETPGGGLRLLLTPNQAGQAGSAFVTKPISFHAGNTFSYTFQFQMTDPVVEAADGMTFVLQTQGPKAVGGNGGCLGYAGAPLAGDCPPATGGVSPSVAVEFDDYDNAPYDINDNHVAILTDGQLNDLDPQTPYGVTNCQPTGGFGCMSNGDVWYVWIDYDGTTLHVALADNTDVRPANLINYAIDIPSILGGSSAYVGFTAGTGEGCENHYVMNFKPGNP